MSLLDMDTATTDHLPGDQLKNAVENYVISGLQAIDWEPAGRARGGQIIAHGQRAVLVTVEVLDDGVRAKS